MKGTKMNKMKKEEIFKLLYEKTNTGIAVHEIVVDKQGNPVDFIFLEANSAYEKLTKLKLKDIKGKRGKEVIPNLEAKWIELYGKVALTGESIYVIEHSDYLDKYWDVKAYSPAKNLFAVALNDVTESEVAKKELIATKELSERYLQMAGSIFVSLDPLGNILVLNNKGLEILGYKKEEIIGKNWFDTCIPTEISQQIKAVFKQVFAGEMQGVEHFENEIVTKKGERKTISWYNSYIKNDTGQTEYLLSSGVDVTEITAAAAELKENEAIFRSVYENMSVGVAFISLDFTVERANYAYCKMLGYKEAELIGKHVGEYTVKEVLAEIIEKQRMLQYGEIDHYRMEKQFIHRDGHTVYAIQDANLIRGLDDEPIYFLGTVVDITDRKKAENDLKISRERLKMSLEVNRATVFEDNIITDDMFCTPELFKFLGYSEQEVPNKISQFVQMIHPDDVENVNTILSEYLTGRRTEFYAEYRIKTKSGDWIWIDGRGSIIKKNSQNEPEIIIGMSRDINDRKLTELELKKHKEHLEEVVAERTSKLKAQNEELEKFNKLFVDREFRIRELKEKIKKLEMQLKIYKKK